MYCRRAMYLHKKTREGPSAFDDKKRQKKNPSFEFVEKREVSVDKSSTVNDCTPPRINKRGAAAQNVKKKKKGIGESFLSRTIGKKDERERESRCLSEVL